MWDSVDKALEGLFNLAAKSPQSVKSIFFSDGCKVDCRSIRGTEDYDNSRIPSERITLARNILSRCYGELEQMESFFFLYHYGTMSEYLPQLNLGISLLTGEDIKLVDAVVKGYNTGKATPLAEIANQFELVYSTADNKCRKIRKSLDVIKCDMAANVENILIAEGIVKYLSESA